MSKKMTTKQLLMAIVVQRAIDDDFAFEEKPAEITAENVEELYDELCDDDAHWDYLSELREGEVETGLPCEWSRHYESMSVAVKAPNGQYVGWTYWYGGGKHGEPEAIDWMHDAYLLDVKEEEKLVVVQTFTKREQ